MAASFHTNRLYSDKEIGALIQRATELQEAATDSEKHNLSIEEIEQIAIEIGIDPEHLRTAALELNSRLGSDESFNLWGGPFVINQHRAVDGSLTQEQWEQLVLELRRLTGHMGRTGELGRMREWTYSLDDLYHTQVTLNPHNDRTGIQVVNQYKGVAGIAYTAAFFVTATLAGIMLDGGSLSDLANFAIAGGSGLSGLAAMRMGLVMWGKRQRRKLRQLTDHLQMTLSRFKSAAEPEPVQASEPLIALEEEVPSSSVTASRAGLGTRG